MKIFKLSPLLIAVCAVCAPLRAADPNATTNTSITVMAIALPKDQALAFTAKHDMDGKAEEALKELQGMVAQKSAVSEANVAVTTLGGQRAVSDSGTTTLEAEPVIMPAGGVDVNLKFVCNKDEIITSLRALKTGDLKYIGSVDSADKGMTCLAFMRVVVGK
jgi:hypothetical protein